MDRRTRNRLLLVVIGVGLCNFLIYTFGYWYLQGDASNGAIVDGRFYLRGHFIREKAGLLTEPVSRSVWVYSYAHAISIWPTIGAVLVSFLVLAKPHVMATIGWSSRRWMPSVVGMSIGVVLLLTGWYTLHFLLDFQRAMACVTNGSNYGVIP